MGRVEQRRSGRLCNSAGETSLAAFRGFKRKIPQTPKTCLRAEHHWKVGGGVLSKQPCWQVNPQDLRESPWTDEEEKPYTAGSSAHPRAHKFTHVDKQWDCAHPRNAKYLPLQPAWKDPPISTQHQTVHERSLASGSRSAETRPTGRERSWSSCGCWDRPPGGASGGTQSPGGRSWIHPCQQRSLNQPSRCSAPSSPSLREINLTNVLRSPPRGHKEPPEVSV